MLESSLRIALMSHDATRPARADLTRSWGQALSRHRLCGTGTTAGEVIQVCTNLQADEPPSGSKGRDPQALVRISPVTQIPLALNRASTGHLSEAIFVLRGHC
jgi:methylglyoxal synthase